MSTTSCRMWCEANGLKPHEELATFRRLLERIAIMEARIKGTITWEIVPGQWISSDLIRKIAGELEELVRLDRDGEG